jgi:hypothetical protein
MLGSFSIKFYAEIILNSMRVLSIKGKLLIAKIKPHSIVGIVSSQKSPGTKYL